MSAKTQIDHNTQNFQARRYRFYIVVHIDLQQKNKKQDGGQKSKWPQK